MKATETLKRLIAEHRELEKLIPLRPTKMRKRVAKSELWSRSERQELSRLAEEFLKNKNRFFGVTTHHDKWRAQLTIDEKQETLGTFGHELLAAVCVNTHIAYLNLDKPLNVIDPNEWEQAGIYD